MIENLNILLASIAWICAFLFLGSLVSLRKVAGNNLKALLTSLAFCSLTIGLYFFTEGDSLWVASITLVAVSVLAFLMIRGYFYMIKVYSTKKSWFLNEEFRDVLITVGLFSAVGKKLRSYDVAKKFSEGNTPNLTYSFFNKAPFNEKLHLSKDGNSYMRRTPKWYGIFVTCHIKKGFSFNPHLHNCWEYVFVKRGILEYPIVGKTLKAKDTIRLFPHKVHNPTCPVDTDIIVIFIKQWSLESLLFRLFIWRSIKRQYYEL